LEQVTENVYFEPKLRGCNPGFVVTSDGVVVIDTPQLPTKAVEMRRLAESHGPIRYLINTEHHVDHIFGNYFFKGAGTVVQHQGVYDLFMVVMPTIDPYKYGMEAIPMDDPEGGKIMPDRDTFFRDSNKGTIVFNRDLTLHVGDHTFHLIHTPGHTRGQIAVHVPEERVVFTGDTIFHDVQTWLMESDVPQWLEALEQVRALDVDHLLPGHGPVTTTDYVATQRSVLLDWTSAVADAVAKGWTREETIKRVSFADRYPVDIGQGYMMEHIQTRNAAALYDKLTARPAQGI
jgi:cyclase